MAYLVNWIKASRPKTLVASCVPIYVATQLFSQIYPLNQRTLVLSLSCFLFITLIQVSTNFANDYFDAKSGADENRKNAPERVVSSGRLKQQHVLYAALFLLFLSFCIGLFVLLYSQSSFWLLPLGVLCIFLAILYTGGPFPLAYNGLGDVFVVIFFGFVAVELTKYVLCSASAVHFDFSMGVSFSVGLLINNLLVINNYRDFENDQKVEKKTSIVLLGKNFGISLFLAGFLVPVFLGIHSNNYAILVILPTSVASLYFLLKNSSLISSNRSLSLSALSVVLYGLLCVT